MKPPNPPPEKPVEIPYQVLSEEALDGVLQEFVLREGTDYGRLEVELATKVRQLRRQLESGEAKICFDARTESVTLVARKDWKDNSGFEQVLGDDVGDEHVQREIPD